MKKHELIERAEQGEVIGDGRKQIEALVESIEFTQEWYAVRWEKLRDLFREFPEINKAACCIMANGVRGVSDPPTYTQMMVKLKHKLKRANETIDDLQRVAER